jgi:hypothetical protein
MTFYFYRSKNKLEGWVKTSTHVEKYIEKQKSPQKEIVQRLRDIILKTLPDIKEEFKMGVPWYEERFYVVALRDHVNLGFSVKGLSEREMALFEGKGRMMRHIKFFSLEDVDEARVVKSLRLVAEKGVGCDHALTKRKAKKHT